MHIKYFFELLNIAILSLPNPEKGGKFIYMSISLKPIKIQKEMGQMCLVHIVTAVLHRQYRDSRYLFKILQDAHITNSDNSIYVEIIFLPLKQNSLNVKKNKKQQKKLAAVKGDHDIVTKN